MLLATLLFTASVASKAEVSGIVAGRVPEGTAWYEHWVERQSFIASHVDGLALDYFIHGELGDDPAIMAGLRRGRISIAGSSLTGVASIIPETAIIALPYLFRTEEETDAYFTCCAGDLFKTLFEEKGLVFLGWSEAGWKNIFSTSPLQVPDDASGLRFRVPPAITSREFVNQIGGEPTSIGLSDMLSAFETGLVDGGMGTIPYYWGTVQGAAPHLLLTKHAYEVAPFLANKSWWNRLSDVQQSLLRDAFSRFSDEARQVRMSEGDILYSMAASKVLTITHVNERSRDEWIKAGLASHQKAITEIGGSAQLLYDQIQDDLTRIRQTLFNGQTP